MYSKSKIHFAEKYTATEISLFLNYKFFISVIFILSVIKNSFSYTYPKNIYLSGVLKVVKFLLMFRA